MALYQKIVVKVGTNVLTREDGYPDLSAISRLVDQIAAVKKQGTHVILVSSGAVGAGRTLRPDLKDLGRVTRRQVLSAMGQIKLMQIYDSFFSNYRLFCAQVLTTKEDFRDRQHYINMKNCFQALQREDIVPVVNENDVISIDELMFTDNDELAGLVAAMTGADALFILTNVDGIYSGPPSDPASFIIPEIDPDDEKAGQNIQPVKSSFGRGGMQTKLRMARKAAKAGITTYIANGKKSGVLTQLLEGARVGTKITGRKSLSGIKTWMIFNEGGHKGKVVVNAGAEGALCAEKTISSLLPVGIVRIEGEFEKGDLVQIYNEAGSLLGMGLTQYDAQTAARYAGQVNKKPLIHYDYLIIEK